ncbi:hypothetical protein jhhlp_000354 [Lomentospora prolificans]|uniref:Uncharacterized protein n=1 Tax=Lomentospora prolificans TaxID=41688 RepID=A0A2N3NKP4_9PEZI|nr:hypothetical protein jhhlp_000354 [Lomentospora prolificans]
MGVSGLLPLLKSIQKHSDLKRYNGKTLGVDAYGWLHRGAIACANELAQDKPTRKYVQYAMSRVHMLRHFGVTPYLVFDGDFLPSKAGTEASRARSRDEHKKKGMEYIKAGKPSLAWQEFQKSIDITPEMARHLIDELKKLDISYVVAPYEADAQLVYLERKGLIDGILSEDSDLLVFGAKRLITKLDKYGACIEINRRDFCACREVSLTGWTDQDFRRMAILSGCDYLPGLKGTGLKTAYRYLRKYKTPDKVVQRIQFEGKAIVSENYLPSFRQAELTFIYQRVFCPEKQELVLLTEDPTNEAEKYPFIGAPVEPELARAIAVGDVNPITKQKIVVQAPSPKRRRASSMAFQPTPADTRSPNTKLTGRDPKPINSYFKRNSRIPMGEMDRNQFAVDSQRVAELTHGGLVPRVYPLPRPYLESARVPQRGGIPSSRPAQMSTSPRLRRQTETMASTLANVGYGQSTPGQKTGFLSGTQHTPLATPSPTSQRPLKKARLCIGDETDEDPSSSVSERSKFFSPKATEPEEPSLPKPSSQEAKGSRPAECIFSDDSVEEAFKLLPVWEGWSLPSQSRRSIEIFDEEAHRKEDDGLRTSQKTPVQEEQAEPTEPAEAERNEMPPPALPSPDRPTSTPPRVSYQRVSLTKFFYKTESSQSSEVDSDPSQSIASTASSQSSVFTPSLSRSTTATPSTGMSMMTPLQRLGNQAMQRGGRSPLASIVGNKKPARPEPRRSSLASFPVNPAFVPLPKVDLDEVAALNTCGSEDQIPFIDKDTEPESEADVDNFGPTHVRLDLSRFLHK